MWPHLRVAWWDIKSSLAMRGRRIAAAFALTALAGSGLAAFQYFGSPSQAADVAGDDQPVPTVDPAFVSPTQPWPGTNP
jgi:hypothetical protein